MRPALLAFLVWVMGLGVGAQGLMWEKQFGYLRTDELTDVMASPDGNFIACGTSYTLGTSDFGQNRHDAICVLSIKPNGDTAWFWPTGIYGTYPRVCQGDAQGFFLVATSTFTPPLTIEGNLVLAKISYEGQVLWQRAIPATDKLTHTSRVIRSSRGRIVVTGKRIALNFPTHSYDMFAIMLDTLGIVYFNERYSDNPRTYGNWIEETPRGTFLASGTAGSKIWAIEIETNGAEIRRQTMYQTPTNAIFDEMATVKQAPGGRYIVSGRPLSFSPIFYYLGSFSSFSSGSEVWGGERSGGTCLIPEVTKDGSIILPHGFTRPLITKFTADSAVVWQLNLPRPTPTSGLFLKAFAYNSDSSAIAVGRYQDFNDPSAPEFYFCRIRNIGVPYNPAEPVSNKLRHKGLPPLITYPTPTSGPLTVHTRSKLPLVVYSLSGKKMMEVAADESGTTMLDVKGLPPGLYVLRQGEATIKIVRE